VHTPLNMIHDYNHVIGSHVASRLVEPSTSSVAAADALADMAAGARRAVAPLDSLHVQTMSGMWRYAFPRHYERIRDAHEEGMLTTSMEVVPPTVTCMQCPAERATFPYRGADATYPGCDHIRPGARAPRKLNMPHFTGGAIIIPPVRPGWADANILEIAAAHEDVAHSVLDQVHDLSPHLSERQAENVMAQLVAMAVGPLPEPAPRVHSIPSLEQLVTGRAAPEPEPVVAADGMPGVIVAVVPSEAAREALAKIGTEPAEELHLTLVFLGKPDESGLLAGGTSRDALVAAVAAFAAGVHPVQAKVSGLGRFALDTGEEVTYASVDAPGLGDLRARLKAALVAAGVDVAMDHDFSPHVSVQFGRSGSGPTEMPPDLAWTISELEVWWGGEHLSVPLLAAAVVASED